MSAANRKATKGTSLAASPHQGERQPGLRAVGLAASRVAAPVVAARGGGLLVRLKAEWPAIVGAEWGAVSWPVALARDGALRLRVGGAGAALDLQHRGPLLIERINLFFGRCVVTRIGLVQGPLPLAARPAPRRERGLTIHEAQAIEAHVAAVADPDLRKALARLGRAIAAAVPPGKVAPEDDNH